jgi:two-component system KDP operon response regulator KdpE
MISGTTILFIDSERNERETLSAYLRMNNFEILEADDGLSGLREFFNVHPDVVIVDLAIGQMSAWHLITRIRELSETPIVAMASEATNEHFGRAFQLGVAGFLARPFQPAELLACLNTIQSRAPNGDKKKGWVYQRNGLTVDLRSCEVMINGNPVSLTGTEYRLLAYMIERRGWVVSHEQILNRVWGVNYLGDKDQVKLYVWYLRRKIEENPSKPRMIVTKRGLGYTFIG